MKFNALSLNNYRPYYGETKLQFDASPETPIYLIHGPNGYGKTSLLMALNWCLYGHQRTRDAYEMFNTHSLEEDKPTMAVGLRLEDEGTPITIYRRIQSTRRIASVNDLEPGELILLENDQRNQVHDSQVLQERINVLVPSEVSQFSFFDGEKIEIYSSDHATDETRSAIASILGLTLLSQAKDDIEKIAYDIGRERNRVLQREDAGHQLAEEMRELDERLVEAKNQKGEIEEKARKLAVDEANLQSQLINQESTKSLLDEIKQLKQRIQSIEDERKSISESLQKAARNVYLDILTPVIAEKLNQLRVVREERLAYQNSHVRTEIAKQIKVELERLNICLCGRPLDELHREHLVTWLEAFVGQMSDEESNDKVPDLSELVRMLENTLEETRQRTSFAELSARFALIENELDELRTALAAKENQLKGIDEDVISGLVEALEKVKEERTRAERELGGLDKTIETLQADKSKLERKSDQLAGQVRGLKLLNSEIDLLQKSAHAFDEIIRRTAIQKKTDIQNASTGFFRQITNKIHGYDQMIINSDFSFGIQTISGTRPAMELISAGEKQVTALSFILGLNEFSRRQAPIVMDTPMGRLDETHRRNVARVLTSLAEKGRQIILFVTDTDIAFGVYEILCPFIGKEFEIVHDQERLISRIEERKRTR